MQFHDLESIGPLKVGGKPTSPDHAVRLRDLDSITQMGSGRPLFITDVRSLEGGNVGNKQYADTIPLNKVLQSCVTDKPNIVIEFIAESGDWYNPTVSIGDFVATIEETEVPRLFKGSIEVHVDQDQDVILESSTGYSSSINIILSTEGPVIESSVISSLPANQIAVKENDIVSVTGSVDNSAVEVKPVTHGASYANNYTCTLKAIDSASEGYREFELNFSVSYLDGELQYYLVGVNHLGTEGPEFSSTDTLILDQSKPAIERWDINYLESFTALRLGDEVSVDIVGVRYEYLEISFKYGSVISSGYSGFKLSIEDLVYSTSNNLTVDLIKPSNGTKTTLECNVYIASIPPELTVLTESPLGEPFTFNIAETETNYKLFLKSDQKLITAPELNTTKGKLLDVWKEESPESWYNVLQLTKDDTGSGEFTLVNARNDAGLNSHTLHNSTFIVRGFDPVTVVFDAGSQHSKLSIPIVDISKVNVVYSGTEDPLTYISNKDDVDNSFTLLDEDLNVTTDNIHYIWLNDKAYAGANTSGTLSVDIQEII